MIILYYYYYHHCHFFSALNYNFTSIRGHPEFFPNSSVPGQLFLRNRLFHHDAEPLSIWKFLSRERRPGLHQLTWASHMTFSKLLCFWLPAALRLEAT